MDKPKIVLLVDVLQLGVAVLRGEVGQELIVRPGKLELVAGPADAVGGHVLIVGGVDKIDLRELTARELQTIDFLHIHQPTLERARQQAGIVGAHHRVLDLQRPEFQGAVGHAHFRCQA
ncbi:hypothetical protein D3C84_706530 [compost metagenome]